MVLTNSPTDSYDAFGQLGLSLDGDGLLTGFISKGLIHGYSVARKLVGTSSNLQAFRVRRSSDNGEQDIGFIGNAVDTASLLSFVGAGDGFVKTLYDQIGTNDAAQLVNADQWRIVNSGSLELENNKLVIRHLVSIGDTKYTLGSANSYNNLTIFGIFSTSDFTGGFKSFAQNTAGTDNFFYNGSNLRFRTNNNVISAAVTITNNQLFTACVNFTTTTGDTNFWLDNVSEGGGIKSTDIFTLNDIIRAPASIEYASGEVLFFNTVLNESDRYNVNKNINNFYNI